jgi:hypothetical protein
VSWLSPSRVAAGLVGLSGVAAAVAPAVAELDTTDTASVLGGLATIVIAGVTWLIGRQQYERRQDDLLKAELLRRSPPAGTPVASPPRALPIVEPLDVVADERADVPGDDALGFADPHDGWAPGDLDETHEAAQQVHLPDAGMPTAADVPDVSVER